MGRKAIAKDLQRNVRWYQRKVDVITFISDMRDICNSAGYFADYPKETKAFWSNFAQQCISNCDYDLNHAFYKFFSQKYMELGQ